MACLIILRGPQCSGKTEVSQRLREKLDEKHKKRTYLLRLNQINTERFKKALNEALDKKYKYVVGEFNYDDSHSTDPRLKINTIKSFRLFWWEENKCVFKDVKTIQSVVHLIK